MRRRADSWLLHRSATEPCSESRGACLSYSFRPAFKQAVYEPDQPLAYVYFPVDAVFSIVTVLDEGGTIEVATAGSEGMRYTDTFLTLLAQSAGCNRAHAVEARLARWLLMTHDRVGRDEFPLTQEFMGQMLGVGRATVNTAASLLQRAGFVRSIRRRITVADRAGLESAACECYGVIGREFDRLLG